MNNMVGFMKINSNKEHNKINFCKKKNSVGISCSNNDEINKFKVITLKRNLTDTNLQMKCVRDSSENEIEKRLFKKRRVVEKKEQVEQKK